MVLAALFIFLLPIVLVTIILLPVFLWLKSIGNKSFKSHIACGFLGSFFIGMLFLLGMYGVNKEFPDYYISFLSLVSGYGCILASLIWWFAIRKLNN